MPSQANGAAMQKANNTNRMKWIFRIFKISIMPAPITFLIPISFFLFNNIKLLNPIRPRHTINKASMLKYITIRL